MDPGAEPVFGVLLFGVLGTKCIRHVECLFYLVGSGKGGRGDPRSRLQALVWGHLLPSAGRSAELLVGSDVRVSGPVGCRSGVRWAFIFGYVISSVRDIWLCTAKSLFF